MLDILSPDSFVYQVCSFLLLNGIPWYECTTVLGFFKQLPVKERLGCFLAVINKAAINNHVQDFV